MTSAPDFIEAHRFMRRVREDFADPEPCECNLCWGENYAAVRALHLVAAPGMTETDIDLAVWEWMHSEGPWAWKRREPSR